MTDEREVRPTVSWLPQLRSRWWTVILGLSLMLNLMVGGIAVGGLLGHARMERLTGASYVQLIPRSFFRDLTKQRRDELMQIVRDNREDLRNLRKQYEGTSLKLAEVLEKDAFTPEDVRQAVTEFSTGTESLAARGGDVVVKIISQLTPEERKLLAQSIRTRDERGHRRSRD